MPAEGLGEAVPASALSGGAATTGATPSSLLSDDWGRSTQAGWYISISHEIWDVSFPAPFFFLHPSLPHPLPQLPARYLEAVPAAAVGSRGRMRCGVVQACQRGKKKKRTVEPSYQVVRALNGA